MFRSIAPRQHSAFFRVLQRRAQHFQPLFGRLPQTAPQRLFKNKRPEIRLAHTATFVDSSRTVKFHA